MSELVHKRKYCGLIYHEANERTSINQMDQMVLILFRQDGYPPLSFPIITGAVEGVLIS